MLLINDILRVKKSTVGLIEYTTRCNLKCIYCAVSNPNWIGQDLKNTTNDIISRQIIDRRPRSLAIHGHGETTIYKGWREIAEYYLDNKINVSICTNLTKNYNEAEINTLARFHHIAISIDTTDEVLFKELRRGSSLGKVINNIKLIINAAEKINNHIEIAWSMVCCDKTVFNLVNSVTDGIKLGVKAFSISNLSIEQGIPGYNIKHVSDMPLEEMKRAIIELNNLKKICSESNVYLDIKAGLFDCLKLKIRELSNDYTI